MNAGECPKCHRPMNLGNSPNSEECTETNDGEGLCEAYAKIHLLRTTLEWVRDETPHDFLGTGSDGKLADREEREWYSRINAALDNSGA